MKNIILKSVMFIVFTIFLIAGTCIDSESYIFVVTVCITGAILYLFVEVNRDYFEKRK